MYRHLLPPNYPTYKAFGSKGEYERKARTIGELPLDLRSAAIGLAEEVLGVARIQAGIPIYRTLGLTKRAFLADSRVWVSYSGYDLPLRFFWKEELRFPDNLTFDSSQERYRNSFVNRLRNRGFDREAAQEQFEAYLLLEDDSLMKGDPSEDADDWVDFYS